MTKTFLLDTNVLMYEPKSIFMFDDNEVVIPLVVLDELDKHKSGDSQISKHARMVIRSLDELREVGDLSKGVVMPNGGTLRVELNHRDAVPTDLDPNRADNRIISVALGIGKISPQKRVSVVTKDINLRVKCDALGVNAEDYISDSVTKSPDLLYAGFKNMSVQHKDIDTIHREGFLELPDMFKMHANEYVLLNSNYDEKHSAMARYDANSGLMMRIRPPKDVWGISSRNKEQAFAFDALMDNNIKLVTITGKAGSGKTLISIASAVYQLLESRDYKRIVLSRPTEPVGRDIGFLPGIMQEKMHPWMMPFHDNLDHLLARRNRSFLDQCVENGDIEICPISYIRGRSLNDCIMILDECQQLSKHEVKTVITRLGDNSKIIMIGDIEQIDTPYLDSGDNGLSYTVEKFKDLDLAAHITLTKGERSKLATVASELL